MCRLLSFLALFFFQGSFVLSQTDLVVVDVGKIPPDDQTYDFSPNSRCRIYGHDSIILQNNNHHMLVIDAGYGLFLTDFNNQQVQVPDLNPYTVVFDLASDFSTRDLNYLWSFRKPHNTPMKRSIVNLGGLWPSKDQNRIWSQGGHFYHGYKYLNSSYHIPKPEIPQWELWEIDLENEDSYNNGWTNITNNIAGYGLVNRTFAEAASSVVGSSKKFWIGGVFDSTTSPTTPNNTIRSTNQMLIFDEINRSISKQTFYSAKELNGYWQGALIHLAIGKSGRSGYLMSLMSQSYPVASPWIDPDGASGNQETGTYVKLDSIPMYDIDKDIWFEQATTWFKDELPQSRTRFCAALFQDKEGRTWDLWIHGGQQVGDHQDEGVDEIYVLSMPSFMWTRVQTTLPETNRIRSHTCHAVGGQLLIVGGYPAGINQTTASCDPEYIKVLDIRQDTLVWSGLYNEGSVYRTPNAIKEIVAGRTIPQDDFANIQLQEDFAASRRTTKHVTIIAGAAVGGSAATIIVAILIWRWSKHKKHIQKVVDPCPPQYDESTLTKQRQFSSQLPAEDVVRTATELEGSSAAVPIQRSPGQER